jgi:hypothetical protein
MLTKACKKLQKKKGVSRRRESSALYNLDHDISLEVLTFGLCKLEKFNLDAAAANSVTSHELNYHFCY